MRASTNVGPIAVAAATTAALVAVTLGCGGSGPQTPTIGDETSKTQPATASPAPTISANRPPPTIDAPTTTEPTTIPEEHTHTGTTSYDLSFP